MPLRARHTMSLFWGFDKHVLLTMEWLIKLLLPWLLVTHVSCMHMQFVCWCIKIIVFSHMHYGYSVCIIELFHLCTCGPRV